MPHYEDLTPYTETKSFTPLRNVGWLSGWRSYPKGETPADRVERLWEYVDHGTASTRGYQPCPICCRWSLPPARREPIAELRNGTMYQLGSRELRVFGNEGGFAAPDLLIHYVLRHQYRPPSEFLDALQHGPRPGSREYLERFHAAMGSNPTRIEGPTEDRRVRRTDLFRIPPKLLDDADYFEDEPSRLEIEEHAYFAERSGFDGVVHVRVEPVRVVVEAGRLRVAAARFRNTTALASVSGSDREKWLTRNGLEQTETRLPADADPTWVREPHVLRFADALNHDQQRGIEQLILRYFSRDYMLALDRESSLVVAPHYQIDSQRFEFVADTPHHDEIWTTWWRHALGVLSRQEPRLLVYQGYPV